MHARVEHELHLLHSDGSRQRERSRRRQTLRDPAVLEAFEEDFSERLPKTLSDAKTAQDKLDVLRQALRETSGAVLPFQEPRWIRVQDAHVAVWTG